MESSRRPDEARAMEEEPTLLEYWRVLWRYRWVIVAIGLIVCLATVVLTIRTPKVFESTATLIAPRETGGGGLIAGLAASNLIQQVPGLSLPSFTATRDVFLSILKSRTMAEAVIERFKLRERHRTPLMQDAVRRLQGASSVTASREGVISVTIEDTDPALAAAMANFHMEHLEQLLGRIGTGEATRQRVFIAEQLTRAKAELEQVENQMRRFQERNRAIVLQDQTRGAVESAARLKGEIMAAEVQLQVMRNFATETNPDVVSMRRRVDEMRRQLAQMQYGDDLTNRSRGSRSEIYVPFAKVPEVGMELARRTRDLKVQETLVTLLAQQLEQAKIAEARDIPPVQILDRAVPAERHSRPSLRFNLTVAGAASAFGSVLLAFLLEYARGLRGPARGVRSPRGA